MELGITVRNNATFLELKCWDSNNGTPVEASSSSKFVILTHLSIRSDSNLLNLEPILADD